MHHVLLASTVKSVKSMTALSNKAIVEKDT